jgi:hypothetical protein
MKPAMERQPEVPTQQEQPNHEHFSPYFTAAYNQDSQYDSSIYGDTSVSPREQQPPTGISACNFNTYTAWPELMPMLTPPAEDVPFVATTRSPSMDEQAAVSRSDLWFKCYVANTTQRQCLLQALQSPTFAAFANTDIALRSSVDMAVATINNQDVTGSLSEHAKTVLDAETQAILEVRTALNDHSRATSDQLLASVTIMVLGAMVSGDMATFCRHTAGLLRIIAARSTPSYHDGTMSPEHSHDRSVRSMSIY